MSDTATKKKKAPPPRLKESFFSQVAKEYLKRKSLKNPMQVPQIKKIVVNMGVTEAKENIKAMDAAVEDLGVITGQKPQVRRSKKSISNFKLRQGMPIGARVTLRGNQMYEFLDRLITIAIPRIRDFQGLNPRRGFDGQGNYNLGLKEQYVFPEINLDKSLKAMGMNITIVTTAETDEDALSVLGLMGMPFRKEENKN